MNGPHITDVDRMLRLIDRLDARSGAIWLAIHYAARVRGWDNGELIDDWCALKRLGERAQTKMRG